MNSKEEKKEKKKASVYLKNFHKKLSKLCTKYQTSKETADEWRKTLESSYDEFIEPNEIISKRIKTEITELFSKYDNLGLVDDTCEAFNKNIEPLVKRITDQINILPNTHPIGSIILTSSQFYLIVIGVSLLVGGTGIMTVAEIDILSVISAKSPSITSVEKIDESSKINFVLYENYAMGFKISYPENWLVNEENYNTDDNPQIAISFNPQIDNDDLTSITISGGKFSSSGSNPIFNNYEEFETKFTEIYLQAFPLFTYSISNTIFLDENAIKIEFSTNSKEYDVTGIGYIILDAEKSYSVIYSSSTNEFKKNYEIAKKMFSSFELI